MSLAFFVRLLCHHLAIEETHRSFFLWIPVCFGLGITLFFTCPHWINFSWLLIASAIFILLAGATYYFGRTSWSLSFLVLPYVLHILFILSLGALSLSLGFLTAHWRTQSVTRPTLWAPAIGELSGYVLSVEERLEATTRLIVTPTHFSALPKHRIPERVRVSLRRGSPPAPGDFVRMKVRLMPPPGPARPGGYDFARESFFQKIGAVGSVLGTFQKENSIESMPLEIKMRALLDQARNTLTERIAHFGGGQGGAVAASLVTGKRGLIADETNAVLRAAGIYHIVSISGLHMVLAAGIFFWAIRALLATSTTAIAHWPIKKSAAIGGIIGASAYCIFSGAEIATQRALLMTLVMMMAILFNRPVLSMRNLACSALVCLILAPESLLGPSFQMSFAAVAALIVLGQPFLQPERYEPESHIPYGVRLWRWVIYGFLALIATSFIASLATAPFGIFHFQTFNPLGMVGNALTLPIIEPLVMPAGALGILLLPFGLDPPLWWLMARLMDVVLSVCTLIARIPISTVVIPAFNGPILACFSLSFLWAILWKSSLRWGSILPFAAALSLMFTLEKPDLYIDRTGAGAAFRDSLGRLIILGRSSPFVLEQWLRADGDNRSRDDPSLFAHGWCQKKVCEVPLPNGSILHLIRDPQALQEACQKAFFIITPFSMPQGCRAPYVIARSTLLLRGALEVYMNNTAPFIVGAHDTHHILERWHPWRRVPPMARQMKRKKTAVLNGPLERYKTP